MFETGKNTGNHLTLAAHAVLSPRLRPALRDSCSTWELAALDESRFYLIEWDPLFVLPRSRDKDILDVFPQGTMLCQVDLNGHLAAFLVGHVLDSSHGFVSFTQSHRQIQLFVVAAPILRWLDHFVIASQPNPDSILVRLH